MHIALTYIYTSTHMCIYHAQCTHTYTHTLYHIHTLAHTDIDHMHTHTNTHNQDHYNAYNSYLVSVMCMTLILEQFYFYIRTEHKRNYSTFVHAPCPVSTQHLPLDWFSYN